MMPSNVQEALFHCIFDSYSRVLKTKRKELPRFEKITSHIRFNNLSIEDGAKYAAVEMKVKVHLFLQKWNKWLESYLNNRWCTRCGRKPPMKNNRFFCSNCFRLNGSKVNVAGGGGRVTRGTKEK